jgi:hypothetical protein
MYPSGEWEGFWVQEHYGRQPMAAFRLRFAGGEVAGGGTDVIAAFTFRGTYDERTGAVVMVKQYAGRHRVTYRGTPDGEGSIAGTWSIGDRWTGPFLIRPVVQRPRGDEPITEIR